MMRSCGPGPTMATNPMGQALLPGGSQVTGRDASPSQHLLQVPSLQETGLDLALRAGSYSYYFHVVYEEIPQTGIQSL